MKELLSTSKNQETPKEFPKEVPKLKNALEEKYKSEPVKEITKETTKLPRPTGWRILVLPFRMKEKTKGGIVLGSETIERQQVASQCGNVLAMGGSCYSDKDRYPEGPWCKVGDWVVLPVMLAHRLKLKVGKYGCSMKMKYWQRSRIQRISCININHRRKLCLKEIRSRRMTPR